MAHQPARRGRLPLLAVGSLLAAGSLAAGCGGEEAAPAESCGDGPPAIEVLSGVDDAVAPIADGDRIFLRCGSQGLHHVQFRFAAEGVGPTFRYALTLSDAATDAPISRAAPSATFDFLDVDGACESADVLLVVDAPPDELAERPVAVEARLEDDGGRSADARVEVVIDTTRMGCGY